MRQALASLIALPILPELHALDLREGTSSQVEVALRQVPQHEEAFLSIRDQGIGIPQKERA